MTILADELGLVGAAKAGDRMAFDCLVERYETRIFAASCRLLGSADDADDIVQETFLRAFRALGRTNETLNVGAWLHRIALNAGRDLLRRRGQRRELSWEICADRVSELPEDDPLDLVIGAEEQRAIRQALELLPAHYRQALLLRECGGLSSHAIAAIMGVRRSVIKSLLFRSRVAFRKAYQEVVAVPSSPGRPVAGGERPAVPTGQAADMASRDRGKVVASCGGARYAS
jgi:RNA polymerase sigma-70 factor (ECF subfamily)